MHPPLRRHVWQCPAGVALAGDGLRCPNPSKANQGAQDHHLFAPQHIRAVTRLVSLPPRVQCPGWLWRRAMVLGVFKSRVKPGRIIPFACQHNSPLGTPPHMLVHLQQPVCYLNVTICLTDPCVQCACSFVLMCSALGGVVLAGDDVGGFGEIRGVQGHRLLGSHHIKACVL
jgi:hypothetical protein